MNARGLAVAALVCASLLVAGCGGLLGSGGDPQAAADAKARALEAAADVETYRANVTATIDGRQDDRRLEGGIAVNRTAGTSRAHYAVGVANFVNSRYEIRVIGGAEYVKTGDSWQREVTTSPERPLSTLVGLLENASVSDSGVETVDGVEVRKLGVDISKAEGLATFRTIGGPAGLEVASNLETDTVRATYSVATDTGTLREVSLLVRGRPGAGNRKTYEATWTFHGYGEPVDVSAPETG